MNELKQRLVALGLSEEMTDKAIVTVAEFAKTKLPDNLHPMLDDIVAGKSPDMSRIGGILSGLKGIFGSK